MLRTRWIWIPGMLYLCIFALFTYRQQNTKQPATSRPLAPQEPHVASSGPASIPAIRTDSRFNMSTPMINSGVLLLCYNRPEYLQKTLNAYFSLEESSRYPLYISQHGDDPRVTQVLQQAQIGRPFVSTWQVPRATGKMPGSHFVAQHYKYALDMVFSNHSLDSVIIIEDDMQFSVDFIHMFEETSWLLDADPTLFCISSWNDNAKQNFHPPAARFFRTSYFPGLGWMISGRTYLQQMQSQWPKTTHWDNWIRANFVKDCVAPFQSRNHNFGAKGSSVAQGFFNKHLKDNMWYSGSTYPDYGDLNYLLLANYEKRSKELIASAVVIDKVPTEAPKDSQGNQLPVVMMLYSSSEQYKPIATRLQIWDPPRAEFQSIQEFTIWKTTTLLLVDQRFCQLLPLQLVHKLSLSNVNVMPGEQGQDCISVCTSLNMVCNPQYFSYLSSCDSMKRYFPCTGCIAEIGKDIPSYVSGNLPSHGKCVVSDKSALFLCPGSHPLTTRLCPCGKI